MQTPVFEKPIRDTKTNPNSARCIKIYTALNKLESFPFDKYI